ncbi:hypothetical protein LAZ67_6001807 [Cordylochernes scorpioides]|uniref:Histone-lysine N-methyltransferase SETMAR n=1 Tax=Cordylochernes scorpioides TaxID=51811 RepID=A0ABY6KKF4_9ARAC|nr:hypothetical protein LAZ67_6001807 [Cordylochernes scorpioides]
MTVRQIEETLGIPKTTVDWMMREHLGLRKLSARWVPKLLTPDQKAVRRKLSSDNLALFEANPEEFVTMDETWGHHFTPESKQQSMQWRHSGSPPPKKAKTVPSAGKVMAKQKGRSKSRCCTAKLDVLELSPEKLEGISRTLEHLQGTARCLYCLHICPAIYFMFVRIFVQAHISVCRNLRQCLYLPT